MNALMLTKLMPMCLLCWGVTERPFRVAGFCLRYHGVSCRRWTTWMIILVSVRAIQEITNKILAKQISPDLALTWRSITLLAQRLVSDQKAAAEAGGILPDSCLKKAGNSWRQVGDRRTLDVTACEAVFFRLRQLSRQHSHVSVVWGFHTKNQNVGFSMVKQKHLG